MSHMTKPIIKDVWDGGRMPQLQKARSQKSHSRRCSYVWEGSGPDGSKVFQGATHTIIQHSPTIYFTGEDYSLWPNNSTGDGRALKLSVLLAIGKVCLFLGKSCQYV